jgi:hypothetical protein
MPKRRFVLDTSVQEYFARSSPVETVPTATIWAEKPGTLIEPNLSAKGLDFQANI